jgi:hypothetical protein
MQVFTTSRVPGVNITPEQKALAVKEERWDDAVRFRDIIN